MNTARVMNTARLKKQAGRVSSWVIKAIIGLIFISPLIVGVLFSIQSDDVLGMYPLKLITDNPTLENYITVFQKVPLLTYLKNSFIMCAIAITSQIILSTLAAYGFVFFEFPGKNLLFTLILSTMMIPGEVVVITNFITIQHMGLTNSYLGLVLPSMISGTAVFLMRQYFLTIPRDYKEAATIDGCSDMRFLFQVALPLSIPTVASLAVYLFVQIYNQFFWPLLVTDTAQWRTVQIGISFLVTGDIVSYGRILAGATIAIIPSVVVYIFGQDYIIKGMTAGGIKG